ncbi:hypothetical protein LSCM1_00500 [Leishmania martiniquensis]|uniref:Uncharacterized protein n=1 Tax=Leishmania martiniquensis TaxID=1580590 RepID=A0A836KG52_9TRYP|nr:hypothetical protein LSCM1_00500 [Leishmania martiniquensis]
MKRAHRQSSAHGVSGATNGASTAVAVATEASDGERKKVLKADCSGSDDMSHYSDSPSDAAKATTMLERLWRQVDFAFMDICYTIEDRFTIPQNVAAVPGVVDEEHIQRQGVCMLVGHFLSILVLLAFAAYSRRLSSLMSGASPVMGEILFCVSHLSQVTQEQLGWSLFCSGFLSPSTFDWPAAESGASGAVPMSNGAGGQAVRRSMLGPNGNGGVGVNSGMTSGSQGLAGTGSGVAGGAASNPNTGGHFVRYLLGRKVNNMIRQESLRSYLYYSFYSPSAFLVEQTVWFVFLLATLDLVSMQRLAVAAFFANVVGWLPVYSVKSLAGVGSALLLVFMYWIPSYEMDEALLSVSFSERSLHCVLSAYCGSLCITLLFAETLLLEDVRRVLVQGVSTLPQRLLRAGGHHPTLARLVHGCMWLRFEYFYFIDFYFFLGMMCWLSLVLMEMAAGISVFGIATLLIAVPWLVGDGWTVTPLRALKDTVIYVGFYVVTALLLAHVVPWSGLAFLSNAVQSVAVLFLMAARCEYRQPGGSAYLLLWVAMMCVYLYEKAGMASTTTGSTVLGSHDSMSPSNFAKAMRDVWHGEAEAEEETLGLLNVGCAAFWQLLSRGLGEQGAQLLHFNAVVFGSMMLLCTTVRAVVVEGVCLSSFRPSVFTSAATAGTSTAAWTASAALPVPAGTAATASRGDDSGGAAQTFLERHCCLRGASGFLHGGLMTSSSSAKGRASPQGGGAKVLSCSAANAAKRPWHAPSHAVAAVMDDDASGAGGGGAAVPEDGAWEEAVSEGDKTIEETRKVSLEAESLLTGDVPTDLRTPLVITGESSAEDEGALTSSQASESRAHRSKRESKREPPSQFATTLPTRKSTTVGTLGEKAHPPPASCAGDRKTEKTAPVTLKSVSDITQDVSQTASFGESVNCNPTSLTSPMSSSDVNLTPLSSLRDEHAVPFTSRSSTNAEIPCEPRRERPERERRKERLREREPLKIVASTACGTAPTLSPMAKAELKDPYQQQPQQRPGKPSSEKTPDFEAPACPPSSAAVPLPRSRTEELRKVADTLTDARVPSRQTAAVESKEVARAKRAVADAKGSAATLAKSTSLAASATPACAASAAAGSELRAKNGKDEAACESGGGKKPDGKAKATAGKVSTNLKAAPPPAAGDLKAVAAGAADGAAAFLLPKPRHEQAASAGASATTIAKAALTAAKHAAAELAGGEKRGSHKNTMSTISEFGAFTSPGKAAVSSPALTQLSPSAVVPKTAAQQSVTAVLPAMPVPLPRSVQAADPDSVVEAARKAAEGSERRPEETLQRAWNDVHWSRADSQGASAASKDEHFLASASEVKLEVSRKPSAAAHAEDAEEPDVSYDLDRVFDFLRLKADYPTGMGEGDDDDRSSSAASNANHRHHPTSFLHSESPEQSRAVARSPPTNTGAANRRVSAADGLEAPSNVFSTQPRAHDDGSTARESFTPAQPSRSGSLADITHRAPKPIQSFSQWTAEGVDGFTEGGADSFASVNCSNPSASCNYPTQGTRSPGFHVFSTHPNAAAAAASPFSVQPPLAHMGRMPPGSALLNPELTEDGMESPAATRHMDLTAASTSAYYQLSSAGAPPSPLIDSRQSSFSHNPFSVSTVNLRASPVPSVSSLGRANSDTGTDRNSALSRLRPMPSSQMAMSEQMAMQQTMMVMMRTPDGQLALYPMMYSQSVYMMDLNGMMQTPQGMQMTSQTLPQQPTVLSAASPRGQAGTLAYHVTPDGSYVMTTAPQMSQQMMSQYHQPQEPP